jgi:hypothetical protein
MYREMGMTYWLEKAEPEMASIRMRHRKGTIRGTTAKCTGTTAAAMLCNYSLKLVREGGVEPPRALGPLDPKSSASASFATLAGSSDQSDDPAYP